MKIFPNFRFCRAVAGLLALSGLSVWGQGRGFTEVWSQPNGPDFIYSAASVDLNGDGYADVLVGFHGGVEAFFGSAQGLSKKPDWVWRPNEPGGVGTCVGSAGHLDGDPYPEIYVSSVLARGRGVIYLFKTGPHGPASRPWKTLVGPSKGPGFGERVVCAGKLFGGAYDCLAVADYCFGKERGKVYVYHGGPSGPGPDPDWQAVGEHPGDWFGYSLCGPGDLDGDGVDDLVVGSKNCNGSCLTRSGDPSGLLQHLPDVRSEAWRQAALLPKAGRLSVYYGGQGALAARPGLEMQGESDQEMFGYQFAPLGAGPKGVRARLLVGSIGWKGNRGRVELLEGAPRGQALKRLWETEGAFSGEALGDSLSFVHHLTRRGEAALLVAGLAQDDAWVYQPFHPPFQMRQEAVLHGEPTRVRLNTILCSVGDISGDGQNEALVYIPGAKGKLSLLKYDEK